MNPNDANMPQNLPGSATGGMPVQSPSIPTTTPQAHVPNPQLAQKVDEQVKALVAQYQQDPYKLCEALVQLKASYLAENFNIIPSAAER